MNKRSSASSNMSGQGHFQEFQFSELSGNRRKVDSRLIDSTETILGGGKNSLKPENMFDLRKSLAWDSAFFTSPGVLDSEELFETLNFRGVDTGVDITGGRPPKSLKYELEETDRTSEVSVSNVRKSLAWDSAFFTSAGVLDPEELSIINGGYRKPETHLVPVIDDDMWRSTDSNSTVTHDSYSVSNLEIDLLDGIRASMRNLHEASSNPASSTCKSRGEKRLQHGHTLKRSTVSSQHKVSCRVSGPSTSLKPPKISGCPYPLPTAPMKRASLCENRTKVDNKSIRKSSPGKSMTLPKKTCFRGSSVIIPSSTPPKKSPSSVLPVARCSPNPLRKTDSSIVASVLNSKSPLKYSSPVSSIDGWSSESSSPSVASETTPCKGVRFDHDDAQSSYSRSHCYNQPCLGHEIRERRFGKPPINKIPTRTGASPASENLRASGLRMPSPKIGFFDADNPMLNGGVMSHSAGINRARGSARTGKRGSGGSPVNDSEISKEKAREKRKQQQQGGGRGQNKEDNKENVGNLGNEVEILSKRMKAIGFTELKENNSPFQKRGFL